MSKWHYNVIKQLALTVNCFNTTNLFDFVNGDKCFTLLQVDFHATTCCFLY